MSKLLRLVAATAVSVGVSTGFAAAQSGTITGPTGPQSTNLVTNNSDVDVSMHNTNNIGVGNISGQFASSGDANASDNTTVGGVSSGSSGNNNTTSTVVSASNNSGSGAWAGLLGSGGQSGAITGATGPQSTNEVTNNSDVDVHSTSTNNVGVLNLSFQFSQSGDVNASDNTTVGGVSSGSSGNSNTTSTVITANN